MATKSKQQPKRKRREKLKRFDVTLKDQCWHYRRYEVMASDADEAVRLTLDDVAEYEDDWYGDDEGEVEVEEVEELPNDE